MCRGIILKSKAHHYNDTKCHAKLKSCVLVAWGVMSQAVYPHVRPRSCSRTHARILYPWPRHSAISLVIESERERTGVSADAHMDTLL